MLTKLFIFFIFIFYIFAIQFENYPQSNFSNLFICLSILLFVDITSELFQKYPSKKNLQFIVLKNKKLMSVLEEKNFNTNELNTFFNFKTKAEFDNIVSQFGYLSNKELEEYKEYVYQFIDHNFPIKK